MIRSPEMAALQALLTQMPLDEQQQQQAEELVKKCNPDELQGLGLAAPTRPVVPKGLDKLPPTQRLAAIQRVISSLHYNHAPGYMYNVSKDRPFSNIMNTAREVLRDALPIKCVEAVFLGLLLTSSWSELERLPVGFKSKCQGEVYRHIVLAVHHTPTGQWGALGISRRPNLQYKDLGAATLADLMADYKASYESWGHHLYKIRVGLPVEHDPTYTGQVCWRYCNVSSGRHAWEKCRMVLNAFADNTRMLANRFKVLGFRPPSRGAGDIVDKTGRLPAMRVALSGTTPEPGAARPPVSSIVATTRHASVSPTKRRPVAKMTPEEKTTGGKGRSLQPSPAKARPGCTSAPPRQRPRNNSTNNNTQGRASRPLLPSGHTEPLTPSAAQLKQLQRSGQTFSQTAPGAPLLGSIVLAADVSVLPADSIPTTPRLHAAVEGCQPGVIVQHQEGDGQMPDVVPVVVAEVDGGPEDGGGALCLTLEVDDVQAEALDKLLFEDSSGSDVDEGDKVAC